MRVRPLSVSRGCIDKERKTRDISPGAEAELPAWRGFVRVDVSLREGWGWGVLRNVDKINDFVDELDAFGLSFQFVGGHRWFEVRGRPLRDLCEGH